MGAVTSKNGLILPASFLLFVLAGLSIIASTPVRAITIVDENFEVTPGNLIVGSPTANDLVAKGWDPASGGSCQNYCTAVIQTSVVHGGTRALRYEFRGIHDVPGQTVAQNDAHNASLYRTFSPGYNEIYERWWYRTEVDVLALDGSVQNPAPTQSSYGGVSAKEHYWKTTANVNPIWMHMWGDPHLLYGEQEAFDCGPAPDAAAYLGGNGCKVPQPGSLVTNSVALHDGQWYCIETHQKLNTATGDGVAEAWVDGVQTVKYVNRTFLNPSTQLGALFNWLNIYRQGGDNMYRYEDDYVVATTRIGCGAAPSDTQPPTKPKNLRLQ